MILLVLNASFNLVSDVKHSLNANPEISSNLWKTVL